MMKLRLLISILLLSLILPSCNPFKTATERMDRAEDAINTAPEQALASLDSIRRTTLITAPRRARYALLKAMALDKCCIDTTDINLIMPAVRYYTRKGSPDEKMRTYLYLGRIHQNAFQNDSAMVSYLRATSYSERAMDLHYKGILMSSISDVYRMGYNYARALEYEEMAYSCFSAVGDTTNVWYALPHLASLNSSKLNISKSDSLYSVFRQMPILDTAYFVMCMNEHAADLVLSDGVGYLEAIDIFETSTVEFNSPLSVHDSYVYAYALEKAGKSDSADEILSLIHSSAPDSLYQDVWEYRIYKHRKKYPEALTFLENATRNQQPEVLRALEMSLDRVQSHYFQTEAQIAKERSEKLSLQRRLLLLSVLVIVLAFLICYIYLKKEIASKIEMISNLKAETESQLDFLRTEYDTKVNRALAEDQIARMDLIRIKAKYINLYKSRFEQINELCSLFFSTGPEMRQVLLFSKIRKELSFLENDCEGQRQFESLLNDSFDDVMIKLREDFSSWREREIRFVAYLIAGFQTKTIAGILGMTPSSIDVKKIRIKEKIRNSSSPNKQIYLDLMSGKVPDFDKLRADGGPESN